jgi:hypothetical protein
MVSHLSMTTQHRTRAGLCFLFHIIFLLLFAWSMNLYFFASSYLVRTILDQISMWCWNPLIDKLKKLWNGVEPYDSHKKQKFTHQVVYLWSIHDFMVYGIFVGWSIHGRLTCLICRSNTDCFHLTAGGKISYIDCHQCWLPLKHPFRMQKDSFMKDTIIKKEPPKRLSGPKTAENLSKLY